MRGSFWWTRLPAGLEIDNPDLFDGGSAEDLPGSRPRSRRPIPKPRTIVSSPPSSATARTRRHSPSPMSCAPSAPANMCCRPRPSRTCTGPHRFGRTDFGEVEISGARKNEQQRPQRRDLALRRRRHRAVVGLAVPGAWLNFQRALGPLDLSALERASNVALDRDGQLLRAFETPDGRWRLPARASDVDPRFFTLLKAYEDKNFDRHHGVDFAALLRAAWQYVRHGHAVSGGSTLTMQAARLLEPRAERTFLAKARQIVRAYELERRFTKSADPRHLSGAGALWRQSRRLARRLAGLFRQGAAPPQLRRSGAAGRAAAGARGAPSRPLARTRRKRRATGCSTARSPRMCWDQPKRAWPRPKTPPLARKNFPNLAPHASEAFFRAHPDRKIAHLTLSARLQASLETLASDSAERLGPKLTMAILVIDNATGRDPRPCRQRRLFRGSARRRHRHDAGPALAGIDVKALHLRHGVRRRDRPSRNLARRFPRALWRLEAG